MRRHSSKWPINAYNIPPHPPAAVWDAYAHFDRLGHEFGRLRGELRNAEGEVREAHAKDVRRIADAAAAGKTVTDQSKHQDQARKKVATLEQKIEGTALAVDEAGNTLAKAIAQHRDDWLAELAEAEREATGRYMSAIAEAKAALVDLRPARGAVQWLAEFDAGPATVGERPQYAGGGRVTIAPIRSNDPMPVVELLDLLMTAAAETEKPQPNRRAA